MNAHTKDVDIRESNFAAMLSAGALRARAEYAETVALAALEHARGVRLDALASMLAAEDAIARAERALAAARADISTAALLERHARDAEMLEAGLASVRRVLERPATARGEA